MRFNVLAVSAHHDDVELGCGGTLAHHVQRGDRVHLVVTTKNGRTADHAQRLAEQTLSSDVLGITATFCFDKVSRDLREQDMIMPMLGELINRLNIDVVYTPYPNDTHADHVHTTNALIPAARHCSVLFYQLPSSVNFPPNLYLPLSDGLMEIKETALMCHASQVARTVAGVNLPAWIKAIGQFHAINLLPRVQYAEAFYIYRMLHWLGK